MIFKFNYVTGMSRMSHDVTGMSGMSHDVTEIPGMFNDAKEECYIIVMMGRRVNKTQACSYKSL